MALFLRPWADLHPDLLVQITDRIDDLKSYTSVRGACTTWRRTLAPLFPALLAAAEGATMSTSRPSAASLLMPDSGRSSFELAPVASGSRCVGSNGGWLALCVRVIVGISEAEHPTAFFFFLANPVTGAEIALPPLLHEAKWITKAVFAPNPAADDFAVAAICDADTIIYVTAGDTSWAVLDPVCPGIRDHLADLVYHEQGHKVYCLTRCGLVHVLHLPERRRRKPAVVLDPTKLSVLRPPKGIGVIIQRYHPDMTLPVTIAPYYYWRIRRPPATDLINTPMRTHSWYLSIRDNEDCDEVPAGTMMDDPYWTLSAEPQEPELSSPARIEYLLSATAFAQPYRAVSDIANAKHLVFCEGNMYQVWRNTSCTVNLQGPGGVGQHRVLLGEVIVLRYYPNRGHRSWWDVVKDLGGYSFFVGRNNAVSVYAEGVPGLRANCVYWIDGHCREKGMVFDMATGRSTPCRPPAEVAAPDECPRRMCLWYFMSDMVTTDSSNGGRS
ncbi:unnamed protein product [Urochloa decumbens]|uniref:KIB1-4 beta-propeller domain-containing protein n=1 Tax=Urochloa decumbens TaxID=240449 RepID=A0ABC8Z6J2_9POAL